MKGVQCYELFGGIALENHEFSSFPLLWPCQFVNFCRLAVFLQTIKVPLFVMKLHHKNEIKTIYNNVTFTT